MRLHSALLALGILLIGLVAPALGTTFEEFGRLNNDDEAGFIAFELQTAADYLKTQGHPEQADKAIAYFHEPGPHGGVAQLAGNMKSMYATNRKNDSLARGFDTPPSTVEDAIARTLRGTGITVPVKMLLKAGDSFRPDGPPRQHG